MIVARHVSSLRSMGLPWVVTVGTFDGVHVGHQAVLNRLTCVARDTRATALVVTEVTEDGALACFRQRVDMMRALGVDVVCFVRRHEHGHGQRRLWETLPHKLPIQAHIVGAATAFDALPTARDSPVRMERVPMVAIDGAVVTTARISALIVEGHLEEARRCLGRHYTVGGRVIHGQHRGRRLGFPTANLRVEGLQLPPNGVYAVRFSLAGHVHTGVANLGINPTFGGSARSLETHVFDFDGDLYGRYAEVAFVSYLRGERKFAGVDALLEQIRSDCAEARRLLS